MSEDKPLLDQQEDDVPRQVKFTYVKSNLFRVVHVDTVIGGITPNFDINLNLCSERFPIPREMVYRLDENDSLGEEVIEKRVQLDAIVREVEIAAVMDLDTAKQMLLWLDQTVAKLEAAREQDND